MNMELVESDPHTSLKVAFCGSCCKFANVITQYLLVLSEQNLKQLPNLQMHEHGWLSQQNNKMKCTGNTGKNFTDNL